MRTEQRGQQSRTDEPIFGGVWTKTKNSSPRCHAKGTNTSCCRRLSSSHSSTKNRITTFLYAYTVCNWSKIIKNDSKVEIRREHAQSINFLTTFSYSTSIVLRGLRRLLLAVLMWPGVDLENFIGQKRRRAILEFFFESLIVHGTQTRRERVVIFGNLGECNMLYSNKSKAQYTMLHYADRWRQKRKLFKIGK